MPAGCEPNTGETRRGIDRERLLSETFVRTVEHHAEIASTNDRALELAAKTMPDAIAPVLIVADRDIHAQEVLGRLRVELAGRLKLADPDVLAYVWVHRFPMYQWDEDARRWDATHRLSNSGQRPSSSAPATT